MKKVMLTAVAATVLFSSSVQAEQVGVVQGVVGTGVAVLRAPGLTLSNIIQGRAVYAGNLAPLGLNFAKAIVPILVNADVPTSVETLAIPLPGPSFLNLNLVNLPGKIGVNVKAAGPVLVTVSTGF